MESIVNYIGCGIYYSASKREQVYYAVSAFSDIEKIIIPLFNKYLLLGSKKQDYLDFLKVDELIKSKDHLTKQGLDKVMLIKSNINSTRSNSVSDTTAE